MASSPLTALLRPAASAVLLLAGSPLAPATAQDDAGAAATPPQADAEAASTPQADAQGVAWGPWWVIGPFDHPEGTRTVEPEHDPEDEIEDMKAGREFDELDEDYRGKGRAELRWIRLGPEQHDPSKPDTGLINLNTVVPAPPQVSNWNTNAVAYLYRPIDAPRDMEVEIMCGSDDGLRIWLNGELVLSRNAARGVNLRDERLYLPLEKGRNHLAVKVNNGAGGWGFQMDRHQRIEQAKINASIDRGVEWLLSRQLIDGSWQQQQNQYRNGATGLAVYTLLKSGVPPRHPAVLEALTFLAQQPTVKTYSSGCVMMALEATNDEQYLPWMEELLVDLLSWQTRDGIWGYPEGHPDLSCTQFAALGLRAAALSGLEIDDRVWVELAEGVMEHQLDRERVETPERLEDVYGGRMAVAGFAYRPVHPMSARGSMTTAGIATLKICQEMLGEDCPGRLEREIEQRIDLGMNWMTRHWSVSTNPGVGHYLHYYLYGMERVGALLGTEEIGGNEWYWDGAAFLIESQVGDGHWADPYGRNVSATCFALLFLERATSGAFTDPHGESEKLVAKSTPESGPLELAAMSDSPASFWLQSIDRTALGERRIVEVEYRAREDGGDWQTLAIKEAPEQPTLRERYAARYTFPRVGTYQVQALAWLDDESSLESGVATLRIEVATESGIHAYAEDAARNLVPRGEPEVEASSGGNPHHVHDNRTWTRWVCAPNDAQPTLTLEFRRPIKARKLLLTHARTRLAEQDNNPRPTRVTVWLNGDEDEAWSFDVDPDPRKKTAFRFPEEDTVRELTIRIDAITGGELGQASVGFTEVELQGPRTRRGRR